MASFSRHIRLCQYRAIAFLEKNPCSRKLSNYFIKLDVQDTTSSLWASWMPKLAGEEKGHCAGWVDWWQLSWGNWLDTKIWGGGGVCLENLLILQCRIKVNRETNIGRLIIGRSFRNEGLYTFLRQKEISGHHQLKMSLVRQGGTMAVQISLL